MKHVIVDLHISDDDYLAWYTGQVKMVHCYARDGRSVRFPASVLQRFVSRDGVHGTFAIWFDDNGKLLKAERLD